MADVAARIRVAVARHGVLQHGLGLLALRLDPGHRLAAQLVEHRSVQGRVAQQLAHQLDRRRQLLAARLKAHRQRPRSVALEADADLGAQRIEPVLHLLARQVGRALVQHGGQQVQRLGLALHRRQVAAAQGDPRRHRLPARGLGQQRELHAGGWRGQAPALRARVDVGRTGIEALGRGRRGLRHEALHLRGHVHGGRRRGAHRLVGGHVGPQRAVGRQQGLRREALHVFQPGRANAVAQQEEQAPVALRHGFRQGHAHLLGVGELLLPGVEPLHAGALQFFGRDRLGRHAFQRGQQGLLCRRHVLPRGERRAEGQEARVVQRLGPGPGAGGQLLLGHALVQPSGRRVAHHQRQQLGRGMVGVRAGHAVIGHHQLRRAADATQRDRALAVLHRIQRVQHRQLAVGSRDPAEVALHQREHPGRVELARHDQRRVVRLVVAAVEGLETADVHLLDVGARTDRGIAVVVPLVHRGERLLEQHAFRVVLAHLHLVAHDRHLAVEVLARDEAPGHRVAEPVQVPAQAGVVGGEAGEVVGTVEPGAAVGAQAALVEFRPHRGMPRGALEQQVLQQVRHAGLAVVLVPAADAIGQVHRRRGLGIVGRQQHLQPVGQAVLGDALDLFHGGRGGHRRQSGVQGQQEQR